MFEAPPLTFFAVLWPLAAGMGLVLYTKWRAAARRGSRGALDSQLRLTWQTIEAAPISAPLWLTVDALEEARADRCAVQPAAAKRAETA